MTTDSQKTFSTAIEVDGSSNDDSNSEIEVIEGEDSDNLSQNEDDIDYEEEDFDLYDGDEDDDSGSSENGDDDNEDEEEDEDDYEESQGLGYYSFYTQDSSAQKDNPLIIPYSSYDTDEVRDIQIKEATRVSNIIAVAIDQAETLLRHYKWNGDNLIEKYVDHPAKTLLEAGVGTDPENTSTPIFESPYSAKPASDSFLCCICFDKKVDYDKEHPNSTQSMQTFEMECHHKVCLDCYRTYTKVKILDEGVSESLACPIPKCNVKLNRPAIKSLFADSEPTVMMKYAQYMLREYIRVMDKFTFCPAPDCDFVVECPAFKRVDPTQQVLRVKCKCGNAFCFNCNNTDHRPAPCTITSAWLQRCRDDSETANWIRANTQECPKCHSTIEKNGGCNHMSCKQCRYEFCWVCLGCWSSHGNQFYNCSRFNDDDSKEARVGQERSRTELNRYLHYYNRYRNHQQSLALDSETFATMQSKMRELQDSKGMPWIEVQFLLQAFEVLRKSRHTLTWTYAFAFYLQKTHESMIFEDNQADLELSVEQLSELFEKPATDLASLKVQLLDKSKYVATRRIVMLEHAAKGLLDGAWKYQEYLLRPQKHDT